MDDAVERHRRACDGFARVAHAVPAACWSAPTPCTDWTAREVVLVHTWDLARAADLPAELDGKLCARANAGIRASGLRRDTAMVGPEVAIADDAAISDQLVAFYGRDPAWVP